jgi:hypothetical protein
MSKSAAQALENEVKEFRSMQKGKPFINIDIKEIIKFNPIDLSI